MTPCACCGSPYHESTGHRVSDTMVWCGPCTRDFSRWCASHLKRKWGKMNFYEAAFPAHTHLDEAEIATALSGGPAQDRAVSHLTDCRGCRDMLTRELSARRDERLHT